MSTLVRQLIAFDMLKQELEDVQISREQELVSDAHIKLLDQCAQAHQAILELIADLNEYEFACCIEHLEFEYKIGTKKLLGVQHMLLKWSVDFFHAKRKANAILLEDFTQEVEVKLNLWQHKAAKAKKQLAALALALGSDEYAEFVRVYRLSLSELAWPISK